MTPHGRVLIVTGRPGGGKSTVARALAETAGEPGEVHVHGDDFETHAVDTTAMSRDETVATVRDGVEHGRFRLL
jgi:broad-specificity NMP kinase